MEENAYHNESSQEPNLFDDINPTLIQASHGKRLANFIIDQIVFTIVFYAVFFIILIINPDSIYFFESDGSGLLFNLVLLLIYGMFMGITEAIFKGRTLGKLITGTKAVNEDGSNISVSTALTRGISRSVPFNAFSALGSPSYPWHDRWTKTYVVDMKQSGLK